MIIELTFNTVPVILVFISANDMLHKLEAIGVVLGCATNYVAL